MDKRQLKHVTFTDSTKKKDASVKRQRKLRVVLVGDGFIGKTSMLLSYAADRWSSNYQPTMYDNYCYNITVDDNSYSLELTDTAGQDEHERLRVFAYPQADCILCCFALDSLNSLQNAQYKWHPEVRKYNPTCPIILVGTKSDLLGDINAKYNLLPHDKMVKSKDILKVKKSKVFDEIVECSAINQSGLRRVFDLAITAAMINRGFYKTKKSKFLDFVDSVGKLIK